MSVCEAAGERLAPRVGRPFSLPSIIKVSGHTESSEGVEGQETRGPTGLSWASLSLTYTYIHTHIHILKQIATTGRPTHWRSTDGKGR